MRIIVFLLLTIYLSGTAWAQFPSEEARSKVIEAYGGKKLETLKSVSIQSDRRLAYPNTDYTPEFNEFVEDRYHFQIDLLNRMASTERHVAQNGNVFHDQVMTTDQGLAHLNYPLNRVSYRDDFSFYDEFGTVFRISDTLLAYAIAKHADRIKPVGLRTYRGKDLYLLEIKLPETEQPLIVSIEKETGKIIQLDRAVGSRKIIYLYRDHTKTSGILYARENQVFLDGELFDFETNRKMMVNRVRKSAFKIPTGFNDYTAPDSVKIEVIKISETVYHVGSGISYSTFILTNEGVIAWGLNDGLKTRFEALQVEVPTANRITKAIVSHHHEMRRSGISDAIEMGAEIYAPENTRDQFEGLSSSSPRKVTTLQSGDTIGPLTLYEVETAHTISMFVAYLPSEKLMLEEDHYRPVFEGRPGHIFGASVSLVKAINELGLDIDYLLSGHGSKEETWAELLDVALTQKDNTCIRNRAICKGDW